MPKVLRDNAVLLTSLFLAVLVISLALPPLALFKLGLENPALVRHGGFWHMLAAPPSSFLDALAFERPLILEGQYWRLLTAHIVHLNINHALMNAAGLGLLGYYFRRDFSFGGWAGLLLVSMLTISAGLWWGQPWLVGYAGLSGVLHALLYAGLVVTWKEMPRLNSLVLALLVGRLVWEHSPGYDPLYLQAVINGRVIPAAHFYGAMTGLAWGLATLWWQRRQRLRAAAA